MRKSILFLVLSYFAFVSLPVMADSYIGIEKNQVVFKVDEKIKDKVTTRGNTSYTRAEGDCLSYSKKVNYKKNCISYQIVVPDYENRFGVFIKNEITSQDFIGKTVLLYDFTTKKIIDVSYLLPSDLQNIGNFWMWYTSGKISYTVWNGKTNTYTMPLSFSPELFKPVIQ